MIAKFFRKKKGLKYSAVVNHINDCGQLKLDDSGNISITFNSFQPRVVSHQNGKKGIKNRFHIFVSILKRSTGVRNPHLTQFDEFFFKNPLELNANVLNEIYYRLEK